MTLQMRCMTPSIMAGSRHDATAVRRIGRSSAESASTTVECAAQIGCHASLAGFGINVLQRYLAWPSCACVVEQESKPPNSRFDPVKTSRNAPRVSDVHGQRMGHLNNTRRQVQCFGSATGHFDLVPVLRKTIRNGQPHPAAGPVTRATLLLASFPFAALLLVSGKGFAVTPRLSWLHMRRAFLEIPDALRRHGSRDQQATGRPECPEPKQRQTRQCRQSIDRSSKAHGE